MRSILLSVALLLPALFVGAACTDPPPPDKPPEPSPEPPPPEPEPEPTCKAMNDLCEAKADTHLPIPGTDFRFVPPEGWQYATLEEASVAQVGDKGAVLVFGSFEPPPNATKANETRKEMVKSLAELVLIETKSAVSFERPSNKPMKGFSFKLWEREATRGGEAGALLIVSASLKGREIFGVGFAVKDDAETSKTIMKVLESFAQEKDAAGDGKDDKKDPPK
jgi:hypothetical protein